MPYVLIANRSAIEERIARLARCIGLSILQVSTLFYNGYWIFGRLKITHTLSGLSIDDGQAELIGDMAAVDPSSDESISFDSSQYRRFSLKRIRAIWVSRMTTTPDQSLRVGILQCGEVPDTLRDQFGLQPDDRKKPARC